MFSETALDSRGLDIAEVEEKMFEFTISLLGATIQDGGMRERSNGHVPLHHSRNKIKIKIKSE